MKIPRADRPTRSLYIAVAQLLRDDDYLHMTRSQFVGAVMRGMGGGGNPSRINEVLNLLRAEAGVKVDDD